ncbi:hypothetical protein F5Y15DRAFT_417798 [Xylariaceae sp. FL0016]|nr:hypothetical protein F5Y15DRAFT_417798 [Xylariaceae sp. FL0016]
MALTPSDSSFSVRKWKLALPSYYSHDKAKHCFTSTTHTVMKDIPELKDMTAEADNAWSSTLSTPMGGFLWIDHNETHSEPWGVSMFHALHCLSLLRVQVQQSRNAKAGTHDHSAHGTGKHEDHVGHCFSYLAQHILCAADGTVEPPDVIKDSAERLVYWGINGMGYQHQCRDAELLRETVLSSERRPVTPWDWETGDTIRSVFGGGF